MTKRLGSAAVLLMFVLTACQLGGAGRQRAYTSFGVQVSNIVSASVDVADDQYIVVSQEPIYVKQGDDNAIYWYLNPSGPYYFPDTPQHRGINFQQPQMVQTSCHLDNGDKYTFVCTYKKSNKQKYPYAIQVTKDGTNFLTSDPTAMNN